MVGREMTNRYPKRENIMLGDVIFEVKNWNVFHPDDENRQMLKDINIKVVAIIGLQLFQGFKLCK